MYRLPAFLALGTDNNKDRIQGCIEVTVTFVVVYFCVRVGT